MLSFSVVSDCLWSMDYGGRHGNLLQYSFILSGFFLRILWTEEPGGLWPIGSQRVRHDYSEWAWTIALQALLSIGFFRQEYWSGKPFLFPGCLSDGNKPRSLALQVHSLPSEPLGKTTKPIRRKHIFLRSSW